MKPVLDYLIFVSGLVMLFVSGLVMRKGFS